MMITQWFSLYIKKEKSDKLKNKMDKVRRQLVQSIHHKERRDELLATYTLLLIEFENV
ncbi:hypothetical protein [Photobacterium phosphoreum]|uniref:hypothetical protein n=1 Tax=Photobacterium phosphoreum TaxID=659 RepID=UPI0015E6954D|nr:hypothetical protein [Photobacterium phosphoreum]